MSIEEPRLIWPELAFDFLNRFARTGYDNTWRSEECARRRGVFFFERYDRDAVAEQWIHGVNRFGDKARSHQVS